MIVVFCLSNLFIPATLTLINNNLENKILIYTDQLGISQFFTALTNIENITILYQSNQFKFNDTSEILTYFKKRKEILKSIENLSPKQIYFFHNTFGRLENWIIYRLSKKCTVIYFPIFSKLPFSKSFSLKALKGYIFSRLLHNVEVIPLWTGERIIFKTTNKFFKKIKAKKFNTNINYEFIRKTIVNNFNIELKNKIILLTGSVVEMKQVDSKEYKSKIDALIRLIGRENFLAKPHPRFPNRYSLENDLDEIPSFIPMNVLLSENLIVIGYSSVALTETANENSLAISLLNYLNPTSIERKNYFIEYLSNELKNKKAIHFPENISSINEILKINKN